MQRGKMLRQADSSSSNKRIARRCLLPTCNLAQSPDNWAAADEAEPPRGGSPAANATKLPLEELSTASPPMY